MAKHTLRFVDTAVRSARYYGAGPCAEYRFNNIDGLVLVVMRPDQSGTSTKTWRCQYSLTSGGMRLKRKLKLGRYPTVGLAEARRRASEIMARVHEGLDPVALGHTQRLGRARNGLTLAHLIEDYIEDQRRAGVATVGEIERALKRDVVPTLGHIHPAAVTDLQIEAVIDQVAKRGQAMARHVLTYVRGTYNHALRGSPQLRHCYALTHNPADNVGRGRRGKPGKYGRPPIDDRHLNDEEISRFWRALDESETDSRTAIALKLLLLSGQRPSEVREAVIDELDLGGPAAAWLIPGSRTKNGLPHLVPLPALAAQIFAEAIASRTAGAVFPSTATNDGILGEYTLRQAVARLFESGRLTGPRFSPKDLRTTVKTGMAALRVPREIRDAVQNHRPQGIGDRAYNFHDYADEKREALERWERHVRKAVGAA